MRLSLVVFLCSMVWAHGQPPIWTELKKIYPDEGAVFLNRNKIVTLYEKGDSLLAGTEVEERVLLLKDRPDDANDMRIYGSHFQEVTEVDAYTQVWQKSKYVNLPLNGITKKRDTDDAIFFDDSYAYDLMFPMAREGNQLVWKYREHIRDVRFLPNFYFQAYLPQVRGSFIVRVPKGVEIKWQILNDPEKKIQFKQVAKGAMVSYEWTTENMERYKFDSESPKLSYFSPMVALHVTSWQRKNQTVKILSSLEDLQRWYYETIQPISNDSSAALLNTVKQITSPGDSEMDIVRKVFYWVQNNIRYIAFEDGMRGLIPHKPSYVLEKRYGDCKDMASLIVGLLTAAGVKSHYTWIGTRDIPFQYSSFPSPMVDNHMIATYFDPAGNVYFLDGTSNFTPLPFPSAMIQGKEAFIVTGPKDYAVKMVPTIDDGMNKATDSVALRMVGSSLAGTGKMKMTGYQKVNASYDFNKATKERERDNVTQWTEKGSNKFTLTEYEIKNLHEHDQPLELNYEFQLSDYVTYADSEIFVNLNLAKTYYNQFIPGDRKTPRENDYNFTTERFYTLQVPDGYEVEYLPPNAHHEGQVLAFDVSYQAADGVVTLRTRLHHRGLMLYPTDFASWNEAIRPLSSAYKESIILKKKS